MAIDFSGLARVSQLNDGTDAGGLRQLRLDEIQRDPAQPRQHFDKQALNELAESIREHGVIQPITVRNNTDGFGFILVSGERRWRASRLAGKDTIPAVVRDDLDAFAQVIENIQREDLTTAELARWICAQLEGGGLSQREVADKVGKSQAWVKLYANVARMPETFTVALSKGLAHDITALNHLFKLWKDAPKDAERLAASGEPITRVNVAALADRIQAKGAEPARAPLTSAPSPAPTAGKPKGAAAADDAGDSAPPAAAPAGRSDARDLPVRILADYDRQTWAVIYTAQKTQDGATNVLLVNEGGMELYAPLAELRVIAIREA
jgi:ParB family chromosome partitioning protein